MKKSRYLILSIISVMLFASCSNGSNYKDKAIHIYRRANVVDKDFNVRFYNDQPNVPYVEVNSYFKEFFNTTFSLRHEDKVYKYFNDYNCYLGFDVKNQLFFSDELESFDTHPDFAISNGKNFIKTLSIKQNAPQERTVSLRNYHIPIYGENKGVYVPLTFLSKFVGGSALYNIAYNGQDIYVIDRGGQLGTPVDYSTYGAAYYAELNNMSKARPADLAQYSYNELCFVWDNLRGLTSQLVIGDNNLISVGLDATIERYAPKLKQYLLSTNKTQYYEGYYTLLSSLYDGGHTADLANFASYTDVLKEEAKSIDEFAPYITQAANAKMKKGLMDLYHARAKKDAGLGYNRNLNVLNYYHYDNTYKTSYIGFDSFDFDFNAWDDFYNGRGSVPVETDTFAFVRDKLYQAKSDGAENIVLDLTTNGGGAVASLIGLVGLFNKAKSYYNSCDAFNKYRSTYEMAIDINLDGKWDNADAQELEQFNFNVGVLTSEYSFSCGNLFPSMMKELGYKIIGDRSGGGSCAISYESTSEGIPYVRSSQSYLTNNRGDNIDAGIEVDFAIEKLPSELPAPLDEMTYNPANFFDISIVGTYLSSAYSA